ncbi:MAG TPA: hypothetical protein PLY68_03540 [Myxococcota bacterium]|nr:hypothetical protein [Myxococcota bacterium]
MVAWVPSILDDSTASWVVSGDRKTAAFGMAERIASYLATAALAVPIEDTSLSQSSLFGGNTPSVYLTAAIGSLHTALIDNRTRSFLSEGYQISLVQAGGKIHAHPFHVFPGLCPRFGSKWVASGRKLTFCLVSGLLEASDFIESG